MLSATLTAEQFAAIDKAVQPFYKESEGQYVLDADVDSHPQVRGLKSALLKVKEEAKQTATTVQDLQGKEKTFEQKMNEALKERDTLQSRVRHLSIVEAGSRALAAAKANQALLLPHLQQVADLDAKGRLFIRGPNGEALLKKGWQNIDDYMGLDEYVNSLRDHKDFSLAFESTGASGTGGGTDKKTAKPTYGVRGTTAQGNKIW